MTSYVLLRKDGSVRPEMYRVAEPKLNILSWYKCGREFYFDSRLDDYKNECIDKYIRMYSLSLFMLLMQRAYMTTWTKSLIYWIVTQIINDMMRSKSCPRICRDKIKKYCLKGYKIVNYSLCQSFYCKHKYFYIDPLQLQFNILWLFILNRLMMDLWEPKRFVALP
jgi:hypothetical protein